MTESREQIRSVFDHSGPARRPVGRARRLAGLVLAGAVVLAAVLFGLGAWNPWHLVFLQYRFGNPMLGLLLVSLGAVLAHWLAWPVRDEARQGGRIVTRVVLAGLVLVGVFGFGIAGDHFQYEVEVLARSAEGDRAVVMVTDRDAPPTSYIRVWDGAGLVAREVGELGRVCWARSTGTARFDTRDLVVLETPFGVWPFDLDPVTGRPRQVLGPRCPDGPVPATLGAGPAG